MRRSRFFKYFPSPERIKSSRLLKPFGRHLQHHFLWQFNRQSVAGGAAVGLFFGILLPFAQTLLAAVGAIVLRVNLPVAALGTFISNPLTLAPMYYLAYRIGNFLLLEAPLDEESSGGSGTPKVAEKVDAVLAQQGEATGWFPNLVEWATSVGPALSVGLLVLAAAAAAIGYLTISGLWRYHALRRWRTRPGYQPFRLRSWEARTLMPRQLALAIGLIGFMLLAAFDAATSARVNLLALHLLPTLFVTWFVGVRWGIAFAVAIMALQALIGIREGTGTDPYWQIDLASDFVAVLFLIVLQNQLRKTHEELIRLAKHDSLTSTLNRNGFYGALDMEIERCRRYGHPFSLIYLDCDNFKYVNDVLGHHAGDRLLTKVARALRNNVRKIDSIGRLGGDEFAILLPETDRDAARRTTEHLKEKMDMTMQQEKWPVSFSMGVATFANAPINIEAAIELADRLMYQVKKASKDNVAYETF